MIASFARGQIWFEWLRFALVGIKSNLLYYLIYVLLSLAGLTPAPSIAVVFLFGGAYTFWFNKSFVSRDEAAARPQIPGYIAVYLAGLAVNLVLLNALITRFGLDHYAVKRLRSQIIRFGGGAC